MLNLVHSPPTNPTNLRWYEFDHLDYLGVGLVVDCCDCRRDSGKRTANRVHRAPQRGWEIDYLPMIHHHGGFVPLKKRCGEKTGG